MVEWKESSTESSKTYSAESAYKSVEIVETCHGFRSTVWDKIRNNTTFISYAVPNDWTIEELKSKMEAEIENPKEMTQEELLKKYIELWRILNEMWHDGSGESEEAEKLRDRMDPIWYAMTPETIEKANRFHEEDEVNTGG